MAMLESAEPLYSPGQSLRDARERAGLSRREVAERLNLTAGQIAALEADDHAALSGPTFVQGYLRAYGRLLGVAGDELVARYRASLEGQSSPRRPVRQRPTLDCGHSQRYWGLALLALVLTGLWGWQQQRAEEPPELAELPPPPVAEALGQSAVDAVLSPVSALTGKARRAGRERGTMGVSGRPAPLRPEWREEAAEFIARPPRLSRQERPATTEQRAALPARDERS